MNLVTLLVAMHLLLVVMSPYILFDPITDDFS